jgi:hypothetical protein
LGSEKWLVRDRKNARFVNFEGELPFKPALQGRIMTLDCGREGMPEAFATVSWGEVPKAGRYDVYRGKVRDFDAFNFQGLRKLEGW